MPIVGRVPAVSRAETTDLIEFRIMFKSLSGVISEMRASPKWVVVGIKETRPVPPIRFSPRFSSLREKNFFLHNLLAPPRGGRASTYYRLFANIFGKRNMSEN